MKGILVAFVALCAAFTTQARAELTQLNIASQYGLQFLPLVVMRHYGLIEKHAEKAGLTELKVNWVVLGGASPTIDALLSGSVQVGVAGFPTLALLWAKTHGQVKGVGALSAIPHFLNTRNPNVKTIRDFTSMDRIALPSVKISLQAILLEMAAAKAFGEAEYSKLDPLTVSMRDPDASVAIISGSAGITSHFTGLPFAFQELDDSSIHTVTTSFDILGGPFTSTVLIATTKFHDENPKTYAAFFAAYREAFRIIEQDKKEAAKIYIEASKSKMSVDKVYSMLQSPLVKFTATPANVMAFADFMYARGLIDSKPSSANGYYFPEVYAHSEK